MKAVQVFFMLVGMVVLVGAAVLGVMRFLPEPPPRPDQVETPLIAPETLEQMAESAQRLGRVISWIVIGLAAVMQIGAWVAASVKLGRIKKSAMDLEERFQQLEAIDVYFDLPLYFGLLGTVMAFIVITVFPDAGLMFAYVSTALGIVVSMILRLSYLTPYRQRLITRRRQASLGEAG